MSPNHVEHNAALAKARRRRWSGIIGAIIAVTMVMADATDAFAQRRGGSSRGGSRGSSVRSSGSRGSSVGRSSRGSSGARRSGISRSSPRRSTSGMSGSSRSGLSGRSYGRSAPRSTRSGRSSSFGSSQFNRGRPSIGRSTRSIGRSSSGINRSGIGSSRGIRQGDTSNAFTGNRTGVSRRNISAGRSGFTSQRGTAQRGTSRSQRQSGFTSRSGSRNSMRDVSRSGRASSGRSSAFRSGDASRRSSNFGNTRFGRGDSSRRNAFGNRSINYGRDRGRYGNRSINYGRSRFAGRHGFYRGFNRFGFGRRPYRSYGYGGFGFGRFRVGPVYYGHHYYRPWYPYHRRGLHLSFGFGFYGGCLVPPPAIYYPSYYPSYVAPVYVGETVLYDDDYYDYDDDETVVIVENDNPDVLILDGVNNNHPPAATAAPAAELPPNYDPNNPMLQKVNEGAEKFGLGDYAGAAQLFEDVALADRNNADAWFALATAKFAMNDYDRSADAIREGIQIFPDMVNNVFDIRDRYGDLEDFNRHIEQLERHVEANQRDVDAHIVLGFVYHFTGQRQWGEEVFKYIESISPDDAHMARVFLNARPIPASNPGASATSYQAPPTAASYDAGAAALSAPPVQMNQPPVVSAQPRPATIRVFEGSVSDDDRIAPKRISTIDGIVIEFDDVDDGPIDADFKVEVGPTRYEFENVRVGQRVSIRGLSGARYLLTPVAINKEAEVISFTIRAE